MVRDRNPDGAGIEADPNLDWFLAQLRNPDAPAERLALRPAVVRNHPAPRGPAAPRLPESGTGSLADGGRQSKQRPLGPGQSEEASADLLPAGGDQPDVEPGSTATTEQPAAPVQPRRPTASRRTVPKPIAARGSIAAGRASDLQRSPDPDGAASEGDGDTDDVRTTVPAARVLRAPSRRPAPARRIVAGASRPAVPRADLRRPDAPAASADAPAPGRTGQEQATGASPLTDAGERDRENGREDVGIVLQELSAEVSVDGRDSPTAVSPDPVGAKQKRVTVVSPPKRVVDLQRRTAGDLPPLPAAVPEQTVRSTEVPPGSVVEATGSSRAAVDVHAESSGSDSSVTETSDERITQIESSEIEPADPDLEADRANVGGGSRADTMLPDVERSAPRSAIAHVAIAERDSQDVPQQGWRSRTVVPQLVAAAVVGLIAVAGAVGILLPSEQAAEPTLRTETVPDAPSDSDPADSDPTITPAPTQTPELVIPAVPMDSDRETGGAARPESVDAGAGAPSDAPARGSGSPAAPPAPRSPTGSVPSGGTGAGAQTGTGAGTGAATGSVPDEVPAPPPTEVEPPAEEGGDETGTVIGVIVDVVDEILP